MNIYCVRRHGIAAGANDLDAALTRLRALEETPRFPALWMHSYVLRETDGRYGLACVFAAESAAVLCEHAVAARLPAQEILPVAVRHAAHAFAPKHTQLIRRRGGWSSLARYARSLVDARRIAADESLSGRLCWLHSYGVQEDDGSVGSVCLYRASDVATLLDHAERCGIPATEITPVLGRVVCREYHRFPAPATSA